MASLTPKVQMRLSGLALEARNYLQLDCGYDLNYLIRQYLIDLYRSEKAKRATQ